VERVSNSGIEDVGTRDRCAAVFLDRDGVLVEDRGLLVDAAELRIIPGAASALRRLGENGFRLIVVSNQAVVARGMVTPEGVEAIHVDLLRLLEEAGAPRLDAVYFCPHHPNADVPEYRVVCDCRKPEPGSLLRAAEEHHLDLAASFMIGDRMTDIAAGAAAGCRTVLLRRPGTEAPPPTAEEPPEGWRQPDCVCPDLSAAVQWILAVRSS
jgi:D-glycero-D-manno-heptose 1,7-bisphosphate phosphatase